MASFLPKTFLSSLEGLPGYNRAAFEGAHADARQVTSIRINPGKTGNAAPGGAERVPWSSWGYYLPARPYFTFDPLFHAGTYYVQEASGMFLEQALSQVADVARPLRVLDLCGAPGGKSTLLQSILSAGSLLVSNEVIKGRVGVLEENMVKWGGVNTVVTSNDPRDLSRLENYFDVIVVDAPCSGSGLFRRDPEAMREWSPAHVQLCSGRQQRILSDVWPALNRHGLLIYSTCSYSREEDENVLDWVAGELDATGCRLRLSPEWAIVESEGAHKTWGYRFYPDRLKGEGFFIGVLRKNGGSSFAPPRRPAMPERPGKKELELLRGWVRQETPLFFFRQGEQIQALPEVLAAELPVLQSACYLKKAGVVLGMPSSKEFIPEHDLAMSTVVHPDLPAIPLTHEQALYYLRKEEVKIETEHRGWSLVQYEGHNLGWVKVLANRWNNYYPKEWRILKRT